MEEYLILPLVSFILAFFMAPAGVSGAFLLLPFQMSVLGFTTPNVSSTNLVYNLLAIPSGVYRYTVEKRMAWPLVLIVISGTLPGVFLGAVLRVHLFLDPKLFKLFVGCVLLYLASRIAFSVVKPDIRIRKIDRKFGEAKEGLLSAGIPGDAVVRNVSVSFREIVYEFWGEKFSFSPIIALAVSFVVGVVGGIYGIGGGAILAPFFVSFFGLPTYTIAGANLMGTFLTSVVGVVSYSYLGYPPDFTTGILFGIGGFFGLYFGARFQRYMPERLIRLILFVVVIFTALRYITQFFMS
ncbi:sulfite exporter TauE/SafE family protein [Archaeoglobus neptunius]|uniref:sulfite exporter TauE/SafE family protein n=1 Tax=Archaeoglobus neptunius TaxID=2798580 RepID=UPI0019284062|nr:sulfite exporter TauE/SafE family protein [Archaeoglobus neptunius]